jgi:hypothetical protein
MSRKDGRGTGLLYVVLAFLLLAPGLQAETLVGTVKNGTTGKPAAGSDVVLLSLTQGMTETARTKADGGGRFSFNVPNDGMPHLVRVNHQEANYFKMAPPGTTSVEVEIYDSAKKLEGISTTVDVMRFQTEGSTLQVTELYSVSNSSKPPRTLVGDRTFEFALPEQAQIDNSSALGPNSQPVNAAPVPVDGRKGRYYFVFPIRPGETRFQIAYHLPYSGEVAIQPTILQPVEHLVAMMPLSMKFTDASGRFQRLEEEKNANVEVSSAVKPGDQVSFRISGTGTLAAEQDDQAGGSTTGGQAEESASNRPGGGLGAPIEAPDPLSQYKWYILAGLATACWCRLHCQETDQLSSSASNRIGNSISIDWFIRKP